MKCELCNMPAEMRLPDVVGGQSIVRHFCRRCAAIHSDGLAAEVVEHANSQLMGRIHSEWERLAGDHLQKMLDSREEVVNGLTSTSPHIRNVSWQMLLKRWRADVDLLPQCLDTIRYDPDLEVRVRAVYYLVAVYREVVADPRASTCLAEVALAPDTPTRIREAAYFGLLRIRGCQIPRELRRNINQMAAESASPYPIDWEFVRKENGAK